MNSAHRRVAAAAIALAVVAGASIVGVSVAPPSIAAGECPAGWGTYDSASHSCFRTYGWTGSVETYEVPAGVSILDLRVTGARGGSGGGDNQFNNNPGSFGNVGRVQGRIDVSTGQILTIAVGNIGNNGTAGCDGGLGGCISSYGYGGAGGSNPLSGYAGGSGANQAPNRNSGGGGGGGAATVVTTAGVTIVAAGGGGGGGGGSAGRGGDGRTYSAASVTGSTVGSNGSNNGVDGGGGGGGGGGQLGGLGGTAPSGDVGGYGGFAGQSSAPASFSLTSVTGQIGSVVISIPLKPLNDVAPTVPRTLLAPSVASGTPGTWVGADTYAYQWLRCSSSGPATSSIPSDCEPISAEIALAYSVTLDDLGSYLRLSTTATNGSGSTTSISATSTNPVGLGALVVDLAAGSDTGVSSTDDLTNDSTPTYSILGLGIGATYTVTATNGNDTVVLGPFVASATTEERVFPELADGAWDVTAIQEHKDALSTSYISPSSNIVSMVIDTVAPAAPTSLSLNPVSDTGVDTTDLITKDTTPTIDLTGLEVGTKVIVTATRPGSADVTCEITTVASATESCTFTTALSGDGDWTFTAVQIDDAGNSSESSPPLVIELDTTAGVSLSSGPPATGTAATAATSFTATATLTDVPDNGTAFTEADITLGGTSSGWVIDSGSWRQISPTEYEFVVSATSPTQGTLTIDVGAGSYEDVAGVSATPALQWKSTIVVDAPVNTAAPVVTATKGTTTTLGSTLSTSDGTWNDKGDINPVTTYQWQICEDSSGNGCVDVIGATGSTWVPTAAAEGKYVRSIVTRTNVAGEAEQSSNIVGPMTKSPQQINFSAPTDRDYSPTSFTIAPTSVFPGTTDGTGLTVEMSSLTPDVCTVTGIEVTTLKAGTCTLAADQPGDAQFDPATQVVQSFTINKAPQTATTTASATYSSPTDPVSLSTTQLGTGLVTYTVVSGPCVIDANDPTKLVANALGDCVVATTVVGDDRYLAPVNIADVTVKFREIDTVTGPVISDRLTTDGPVAWSPSSTSGRPITITASGACTYDAVNGEIVPSGVGGACTITSEVVDDGQWSAATLTRTFNFAAPPAAPTITNVSVNGSDGVQGGTALLDFTPGAMNGSVLVDYTVTITPVGGGSPMTRNCDASPCTITGLTPGTAYTFEVVTNATAAGDPVSSPASSVSSQVIVKEPHQVRLLGPSRVSPDADPFDVVTMSLVDAAWVPTVVSLTPSVCTVTGVTVTVVGQGTCTLTADHDGGVSGGADYGYGFATVSFPVAPASNVSPPALAGPPVNTTAVINAGRVIVTWQPPASSGAFPVTTYQVISNDGLSCISVTLSCSFLAGRVSSSTTFMVRALTGAGWSPWSNIAAVEVQDDAGAVTPCEGAAECPNPGGPTGPESPNPPEDSTDNRNPGAGDGGTPGRNPVSAPRNPEAVRIVDGPKPGVSLVKVDLPTSSAKRPVETVVIMVLDANGQVIRRIVVDVTDHGKDSVTRRVRIPEGGSIRVFTTNSAGVSANAPRDANVIEAPTIRGYRPDGRPILYGKKIGRPVFFGPDSPELDERARGILDRVADYVGENGGTVLITGFVRKGNGSEERRRQLSSARAQQVASYLASLGVKTWIRYDGAGAYREVDTRVSDRRVEIRWSKSGLPLDR